MKVSEASMHFVLDGLEQRFATYGTFSPLPMCVFVALIQKLTEIIIYIPNHNIKVFLFKLIKNVNKTSDKKVTNNL